MTESSLTYNSTNLCWWTRLKLELTLWSSLPLQDFFNEKIRQIDPTITKDNLLLNLCLSTTERSESKLRRPPLIISENRIKFWLNIKLCFHSNTIFSLRSSYLFIASAINSFPSLQHPLIWNTFVLLEIYGIIFSPLSGLRDLTTVFKWSLPHSRYIVRSQTFPALKLSKSQCSYMTGVSFLESDTAAFLIGFKTRSVFTARHEYLDKVNKEKIYFIVYHIYIAVCSTEGSD